MTPDADFGGIVRLDSDVDRPNYDPVEASDLTMRRGVATIGGLEGVAVSDDDSDQVIWS